MRIDTISLGLGVEVLRKDLARAADDIARMGASVKPVALDVGASSRVASDMGDQLLAVGDRLAARLAGSLGGVGGGVGGALQKLVPVADKTAGAIITGLRRIDTKVTFPHVQDALAALSKGLVDASIVGVFRKTGDKAGKAFAQAVKGAGDLGPILGMVVKELQAMRREFGAFAKLRSEAAAAGPVFYDLAKAVATVPAAAKTGVFSKMWADYEAKGRAAVQVVRDFEARPVARVGPGSGRRIQMAGSAPTQEERLRAADYLGTTKALENLGKTYVRVKALAKIFGTVAGASLELASRWARLAITPVTLLGAAYIKTMAAVGRWTNVLRSFGDVAGKGFGAIFGGAKTAESGLNDATRSAGLLGKSLSLATAPARGVGTAMRGATGAAMGLAGAVRGVGLQIAAAFGFVGAIYKTVQFLRDGVKAASDLNESVNATKQVFGASFDAIDARAKALQKDFGVLRKSQLDAASGFGSIVKGAGGTEKQAAGLSAAFVQLAADFASFKNLSFEEAAGKLRSGLAGESEPLRQYGALITATAVEAKALDLGLGTITRSGKKNKTTFSELALVQARAALIQEKLADANGDHARTSDDAANQFRKAGGGVALFGETLGRLMLPAIKAGTIAFNDVLASVIGFVEQSEPTLRAWGESVANVFNGVGVLIRNFGAFWEIARLQVGAFAENSVRHAEAFAANLGQIGTWLGSEWLNLLKDAFNGAIALFHGLVANVQAVGDALGQWASDPFGGLQVDWKPLFAGFEAQTAKLPDLIKPALINVQGEIDRIMGDVTAKEVARIAGMAKPIADAAKAAAPNAAIGEAAKKPELKLASAVEAGSKEAYTSIITNRAGDGANRDAAKTAKQGVDVAKKQLGVLNKIEAKVGAGALAGLTAFDMGAA